VPAKVLGDLTMTFVVLLVRGMIGDTEVSGRMGYARTWTRERGTWQVIAAHISPSAT
jgi:hypothetical protein